MIIFRIIIIYVILKYNFQINCQVMMDSPPDTQQPQPKKQMIDHVQPSMLTTEPTVHGQVHTGSADNIIEEEGSLFDKGLIDINTA